MKTSNINLILMLTSGIIVGIIGLYWGYSLEKLVYTLVVVLVLFYIIGSFLGFLLQKVILSSKEDDDYLEELEEELEEDAEDEEMRIDD